MENYTNNFILWASIEDYKLEAQQYTSLRDLVTNFSDWGESVLLNLLKEDDAELSARIIGYMQGFVAGHCPEYSGYSVSGAWQTITLYKEENEETGEIKDTNLVFRIENTIKEN
jgi:hypothetical protein